ncbi:MAG: UDP-N-acetylmuramate dehydrogenase [Flavisolibacter sp.]
MQIRENFPLRPYHTFGIDVSARYFSRFQNMEQLQELLAEPLVQQHPKLVLGGGSNVLFTRDYDGVVLKNEISGVEVVEESDENLFVRAGAGENWHSFVIHCVEKGYAGLENLSLIPGNVGASPMQNIGAYGVEVKDVFHKLEAFHIRDRDVHTFTAADCQFGYRESVFKNKYRNQYVITSVTYRLRKTPVFHTEYGAIRQELEKMGVSGLSIKAISQAVINIRSSKLPDPKEVGNAGSFFKNPTIPRQQYADLQKQFADIPSFPFDEERVKVPAGWLIEHCHPDDAGTWKGYRVGDAGCYPKQALVLVNYGSATGQEVFDLSEKILETVKTKFGIELEREVNII